MTALFKAPADLARLTERFLQKKEDLLAKTKAALTSEFASMPEPFAVRLWDGEALRFGPGAPGFTAVIHTPRALLGLDEDSLAEAYFRGDWSIEGDPSKAFAVRQHLKRKLPYLQNLLVLSRVLFVPGSKNNADAIADHYGYGDDFYLSFIDKRYRMYSHGHFHHEDDSLEDAEEHKLRAMFESLGLKRGMRLLDIGGGWGPATEYAGERGVEVTSLTIAPDSKRFIERLIAEKNLPCKVILSDFLDFDPDEPFDAVVIFGVIEHIPQYRAFVDRVWKVLKPGGLMYLDASACRVKYRMSAAVRRTVWTGTATYLSLHDLMAELNYGGLDLLELKNESKDYEITMTHWARRFDENRDHIVGRWGERVYRMFQLYLWSGQHCFRSDLLQAYRMLIRRPERRIADPGTLRRIMSIAYGSR